MTTQASAKRKRPRQQQQLPGDSEVEEEEEEAEEEDEDDEESRRGRAKKLKCCDRCCLLFGDVMQKLCFCLRLGIECPTCDRLDPADRGPIGAAMTGGLCSIIFSFVLFLMMVFGGGLEPLFTALVVAFFMAVTLLLSVFTSEIRLTFILMLPALVSNRMRWLLLMYLTLIVSMGPSVNILRNNSSITLALSCINDQVMYNINIIKTLIKSPFAFVGHKLAMAYDYIRYGIEKTVWRVIKITWKYTKKLGVVLTYVRKVMNSVQSLCNDAEALQHRCKVAILAFTIKIKSNLLDKTGIGSVFIFAPIRILIDGVRALMLSACTVTKVLNIACNYNQLMIKYPELRVFEKISKDIKEAALAAKKKFSVQGQFFGRPKKYKWTYQRDTIERIRRKVDEDFQFLGSIFRYVNISVSFSTLITFFLMFLHAHKFRKAWLKKEYFENEYITKEFMIAEANAEMEGVTTILPLMGKERLQYVPLNAVGMTTGERSRFRSGLFKLVLCILTNWVIIVLDIMVHAAITDIHNTFKVTTTTEPGAFLNMNVTGDGLSSKMLTMMTGLTKMLRKVSFKVDAKACTPQVSPVDPTTTTKAAILTSFVIFAFFFEGYILRLRHVVMINRYPDRARDRALWLRNFMLQQRGVFRMHRVARVKRKIQADSEEEEEEEEEDDEDSLKATWKRFKAKICNTRYGGLLMRQLNLFVYFCRACGLEGKPTDPAFIYNFVQCVQCGSVYCRPCHTFYNNRCLICFIPLIADLEGLDKEQCSSEEEVDLYLARYLRQQKVVKKKKKKKKKKDDD